MARSVLRRTRTAAQIGTGPQSTRNSMAPVHIASKASKWLRKLRARRLPRRHIKRPPVRKEATTADVLPECRLVTMPDGSVVRLCCADGCNNSVADTKEMAGRRHAVCLEHSRSRESYLVQNRKMLWDRASHRSRDEALFAKHKSRTDEGHDKRLEIQHPRRGGVGGARATPCQRIKRPRSETLRHEPSAIVPAPTDGANGPCGSATKSADGSDAAYMQAQTDVQGNGANGDNPEIGDYNMFSDVYERVTFMAQLNAPAGCDVDEVGNSHLLESNDDFLGSGAADSDMALQQSHAVCDVPLIAMLDDMDMAFGESTSTTDNSTLAIEDREYLYMTAAWDGKEDM